jgi:hypothetical protein
MKSAGPAKEDQAKQRIDLVLSILMPPLGRPQFVPGLPTDSSNVPKRSRSPA